MSPIQRAPAARPARSSGSTRRRGAQTVVSSGGQFVDPYSVAVAPDGSLVVADPGTYGGTGTIFRVDPTTGAQSVITTGGYLVDPGVVTFAPDGALLVADFGGGSDARIIQVDPNTGQQTIVSEGGFLTGPFGIATAPDGTIYVADYGPPTTAASSGLVFRVDPTTGQQTIVSAGGQLVTPVGILVAPDGSLIVSDDHAIDQRGAIFRVDPQTGAQTVISQDGSFEQPIGLAFAPDGSLLVADAHAAGGDGALIRVRPDHRVPDDHLVGRGLPEPDRRRRLHGQPARRHPADGRCRRAVHRRGGGHRHARRFGHDRPEPGPFDPHLPLGSERRRHLRRDRLGRDQRRRGGPAPDLLRRRPARQHLDGRPRGHRRAGEREHDQGPDLHREPAAFR